MVRYKRFKRGGNGKTAKHKDESFADITTDQCSDADACWNCVFEDVCRDCYAYGPQDESRLW